MLETILWIIGGLVALSILYFLLKVFFVVMGIKKVLGIVREEVEQMPQDYARMRKEVENENSYAKPTATFTKNILIRWFKRM